MSTGSSKKSSSITSNSEQSWKSPGVIDLDYPAWHTPQDTLDAVSAGSLQVVGGTLEVCLQAANRRDIGERDVDTGPIAVAANRCEQNVEVQNLTACAELDAGLENGAVGRVHVLDARAQLDWPVGKLEILDCTTQVLSRQAE